MLELEKKAEILYRKNVIGLKADRMDRVIRDCACRQNGRADGKWIRNGAAVSGNLPLVVADEANLQELSEILFDGKNLANPPFVGEGLPGGFVGSLFRLVNFPVGEQVCTSSSVLRDVIGGAGLKMVAKVACSDVVGSARRVTAGGNHKAVGHHKVIALPVPADGERLN